MTRFYPARRAAPLEGKKEPVSLLILGGRTGRRANTQRGNPRHDGTFYHEHGTSVTDSRGSSLGGKGMETVELTDLYQATYYLMQGCELTGVECIPAGTGTSCKIRFRGERFTALERAWYDKAARVNLWDFRTAYSEISSHVQNAKRSYERSRKCRQRLQDSIDTEGGEA